MVTRTSGIDEHRDRLRVAAQVAHGGEERRAVQERRQEDQEHEVRVELDVRHAGQEADHRAAHHERHGVRHAQQSGEDREAGDRQEQPEDDQLEVVHDEKGGSIPGVPQVTLTASPDATCATKPARSSSGCARGHPFELAEVDVSLDPELHRAYGERIPVLDLDGEELFEFFVDEADLRQRVDRVDAS